MYHKLLRLPILGLASLVLATAAQAQTATQTPVNGQATVTGTAPLQGKDVGAAATPKPSSTYATIANDLIAKNHFLFNDGTDGWAAGPGYLRHGMYGADTILTMLAAADHFTAPQFLNLVNKFIAARSTGDKSSKVGGNLQVGDFPETVKQDGTAEQYCSGDDRYCHYATGDGRIAVPLALYLYWQRTGDITPYTTNIVAIKTALAIPPRNSSNHLITIVAGQEHIPGIGFLEEMRPLGDVADANVWYAWDCKALAAMATAAGDRANAAFFNSEYKKVVAGLESALTDPKSKMLLFANGSQMKQIDIVDSTLAITPLLGPSAGELLASAHVRAISKWLNRNYSSLVNAEGYVKLVNSCDAVGGIPSGGGEPYFNDGSATGYQCGYWATFGGYFAYALAQTNPHRASIYLETYRNGVLPTTEYYNQGSNTPKGDTALLTAGQSIRWASENPCCRTAKDGVPHGH
jgi:hypothetical protein